MSYPHNFDIIRHSIGIIICHQPAEISAIFIINISLPSFIEQSIRQGTNVDACMFEARIIYHDSRVIVIDHQLAEISVSSILISQCFTFIIVCFTVVSVRHSHMDVCMLESHIIYHCSNVHCDEMNHRLADISLSLAIVFIFQCFTFIIIVQYMYMYTVRSVRDSVMWTYASLSPTSSIIVLLFQCHFINQLIV